MNSLTYLVSLLIVLPRAKVPEEEEHKLDAVSGVVGAVIVVIGEALDKVVLEVALQEEVAIQEDQGRTRRSNYSVQILGFQAFRSLLLLVREEETKSWLY